MQAKRVLPLSLLHAAGGHIEGRTRFQKLAFLADQRLEESGIDVYDFIPYDYGPFTDSLYDELEALERKGLIECTQTPTYGGDTRYDYSLTPKGRESYDKNLPEDPSTSGEETFKEIHEIANDVVEEYSDLPISNLIDYVYDEYPEYAENSVLHQ